MGTEIHSTHAEDQILRRIGFEDTSIGAFVLPKTKCLHDTYHKPTDTDQKQNVRGLMTRHEQP